MVAILFAEQARSYSLQLSTRLVQGIDSFGEHVFHADPSLYKTNNFVVQLMTYRVHQDTTYNEQQGNNSFIHSGDRDETYLAMAGIVDLGGGLWFGLQADQFEIENSNARNDINRTAIEERSKGNFGALKVAVALSENVAVGFTLKFFKVQHDVVGSFRLNPNSSTTSFKTSMFGSGGGLQVGNDKFSMALSFFPPMKGKADILGEEKIISDPGGSDLGLALVLKNGVRAGIQYRRWIYKRDDRIDGTTINDNNETQINLYGLDREWTNIDPITTLVFGVGVPVSQKIELNFSVMREDLVYRETPTANLPGEDDGDPIALLTTLKAFIKVIRGKLTFNLGLTSARSSLNFSTNNVDRKWEVNRRDLWLGIGSEL